MGELALAAVAVALLATTVRFATGRERRARERDDEAARRRAELAGTITASIDDPEVRDAWRMVCDALARGARFEPAELAARLRAGDGMQLLEEASIDIDDETPDRDRVLVYHAGFDPPNRTCPRSRFLAALEQLAARTQQNDHYGPDAE